MDEVQAMQLHIRHLGRVTAALVLVCASCLILTIGVLVEKPVHAAEPQRLTVRRLAVVDEKGIERVVIAAPSPDPVVRGKREKRAGRVSGILISDRDGNERGGYLTDDVHNGAMLTLDAVSGQVVTIYANEDNGATLSLTNQKGDDVALTTWTRPVLQMKQGKTIFIKLPSDAPDLH